MVKLLRIVGVAFLLLGLIGAAVAAGFYGMQWVRDRVWNFDAVHFVLCGAAVAAVGMVTLALLEVRDAIVQASVSSSATPKSDPARRDVRTSYLDIRER